MTLVCSLGVIIVGFIHADNPISLTYHSFGAIMAILGGALITPLQGIVSDAAGINISYLVPLGCFLVVLIYAIRLVKPSVSNES